MLNQSEFARILFESPIVSFMQRNEVIIHLCKGVYISVYVSVAVASAIQLVFIGEIHGKYQICAELDSAKPLTYSL